MVFGYSAWFNYMISATPATSTPPQFSVACIEYFNFRELKTFLWICYIAITDYGNIVHALIFVHKFGRLLILNRMPARSALREFGNDRVVVFCAWTV